MYLKNKCFWCDKVRGGRRLYTKAGAEGVVFQPYLASWGLVFDGEVELELTLDILI